MILQALYELAEAEKLIGDPDFEHKPVSWVVEMTEDGRLIQIADHRLNLNEGKTDKKGKPLKPKWVGKNEEVPLQPSGRTGTKPPAAFAVDMVKFVFGIDLEEKFTHERRMEYFDRFQSQIVAAVADTTDPALAIVLQVIERVAADPESVTLPSDLAPNDMIAFRVGEDTRLVHQRPEVRAWWKAQREPAAADGEARFRCLVSGDPVDEPGLVPLIKPVPGGTPGGVALVSFNTGAFESYGLDSNENAPISRDAAQRVSTAFNRLLNARPVNANGAVLSPRRITLSSDTVLIYWSPNGEPDAIDAMANLLEASSTDAVADLYRSVWRGRMPEMHDPSRFYAATVTGTQGRAIVRGYIDTTVEAAIGSLAKHFADLVIVRNAATPKGQEPPPAIPLRAMLDALAAPGREASVPASLATDIVRAALNPDLAYPLSALQRALLRTRAEAGDIGWVAASRRDARAALIKGVLIRQYNITLETAMNPDTDSDGYQLGMLTAVLERLQAAALGDVNATVVDRFFAAASAAPVAVFPRLLKLARHHVRKIKGVEGRDAALIFRYERIIDAIATRFKVEPRRYPQTGAFPPHLPLSEQGLFVLGYHQMRHWLWMNDAERIAWEQEHSDSPRAFLWKTRKTTETPEPATA